MKRNKTFFYGSLIALAAGLLIFPNHTFAEEQASPLIATGTTVIATDTTQGGNRNIPAGKILTGGDITLAQKRIKK